MLIAVTPSWAPAPVPLSPQDADKSRADVPSSSPHAGQLRLLKGIDGVFRPSILTALMGASGADK